MIQESLIRIRMHPISSKRSRLHGIFTPFIFGALATSSVMAAETNAPTVLSSLPSLATGATMTSGNPETLLKLLSAGGLVMMPLLVLSVITLALILVYLVTLRRGAVAGSRFMTMAETLLGKGDLLGLLAIANKHRDIAASILTRTLEFLASHPAATDDQLREIAQTEGSREASLLNQRVAWLADIATVAPMLGLLGTVFGMIRSFSVMANDVAASRPMLLAEGVAEALVATAAGLVVGIPAMIAYAWFRGRVQEMISEMEGVTSLLLVKLVIARKNSQTPR
jgi:biopolymer transport protein ExbB